MPIYEYRCASCGHELEALQKLSEAPLRVCPTCHKSELVKRVSAVGFQLKGSGWYVTDFRNSGGAKAAKDSAKAGANGNGEAKAAESKPSESTSATTQASGSDVAKAPTTSSEKTGT